ncbi:MAG: ABC transporter ATP-binding protein [Terriglobales bacterium]
MSLLTAHQVSKFYGDVLGVDRVTVAISAGITSLVGPNGAGKTTLMNLFAGLLHPTRGELTVLGRTPGDPELYRQFGYCASWDAFPPGVTAHGFIARYLRLHGYGPAEAARGAGRALERVGLAAVARRRAETFSQGMRQRLRLAQATAHDPQVVILDEPLNGLDPLARAEMATLFRNWAAGGRALLISSHILHEVDAMSDRVLLLDQGYLLGAGSVLTVRGEIRRHPLQILVRCDRPAELAAQAFRWPQVLEARLAAGEAGREDGAEPGAVLVKTRNPEAFLLALNQLAGDGQLHIETVAPVDENLDAVYRFLLTPEPEADHA